MQLKWTDEASLRRLAENSVAGDTHLRESTAKRERLLYDLLVHKAELEMQNEALREAQVELRLAHERYRAFFDKASVAHVVLDTGCLIIAANVRAAQLLCGSPRTLVGKRLTTFLVADDAIPFERFRREAQKTPAPLAAEFRMVIGGEQREIRIESTGDLGDDTEWCVALTDVTIYNAMLRKVDHAERLEVTERRASSVAHSLNNLLFGILGHAEVALHFVDSTAPVYGPLIQLREVVKRCVGTTEQLTAFSRTESEQPSIVDLNTALSDLQGVLPELLGDDIEIVLRLDASDAAVRLDREHVEQIVLTAARNARQAMPHGGSFRIETATVELSDTEKARGIVGTRFVRWTLSDTGIGMTESTRSRAFEPFFTTKPPGVGTGLGLSMVKAAVERSGGFVQLESELGRGTELVIHLPRASGTSYFPAAPREDAEDEPFARVVIVNDNVEMAPVVASRLRAAGCDVSCTRSGSDALDQLRPSEKSPTVVLIDQTCPDFVISELVRGARETSPWLEIVVAPLEPSSEGTNEDARALIDDAVGRVLAAATRGRAR
jgi:signal transduction histidine kinase/CheY-like chemotaxis protein